MSGPGTVKRARNTSEFRPNDQKDSGSHLDRLICGRAICCLAWEPTACGIRWKVSHADIARSVAENNSYGDVTRGRDAALLSLIYTWMVALGSSSSVLTRFAGRVSLGAGRDCRTPVALPCR